MPTEAKRFGAGAAAAPSGVDARCLVDGGVYDVRRIVAAPHSSHGPGRYPGDACVCLLSGSVSFDVDGTAHALDPHDVLWVPAGALRGFIAGPEGAEMLAVHLPKGSVGEGAA